MKATKRAARGPPFPKSLIEGALALRELEAAAGLLLAVLLTLDDARIAGQEAFLLERAAKIRLVVGQRLGEAVTDCAGLAGETATVNVDGDVVLAFALGDLERLSEDHAQHGTGEVDLGRTTVDHDLAGAGLDPHAGNRVLALAGGIGAAERVELLDVLRGFRSGGLGIGAEIGERLEGRHDYALTFLLLRAPTSSVSGC